MRFSHACIILFWWSSFDHPNSVTLLSKQEPTLPGSSRGLARSDICNYTCSLLDPYWSDSTNFEVGLWLAGTIALWHWARSSEIMKRTSGQIPNPPRLDAGINGLIKALLFVLVGRFTRNNQTTVYFSLPRVQTSTCVGCRVRVDLCVVWALLAHRPFWPQISRDSLCEPVASADSTTVIHWVVWLNTEGTSWEKSAFYTQDKRYSGWVN